MAADEPVDLTLETIKFLHIAKVIATNVRRGSTRRVKIYKPSTGEVLRETSLDEALVGMAKVLDVTFSTREDLQQTVCAGWETPCPEKAKPGAHAFKTSHVQRRNGEPWRCKACSSRKCWSNIPSERRSEIGRKGAARLTSEQRSERAKAASASMAPGERGDLTRRSLSKLTPEQLSERSKKSQASMTAEQRSIAARKGKVSMTAERLREIAKKALASMTPEQRSARARKTNATRKAKRGQVTS
jgi:hypothetical protein